MPSDIKNDESGQVVVYDNYFISISAADVYVYVHTERDTQKQ